MDPLISSKYPLNVDNCVRLPHSARIASLSIFPSLILDIFVLLERFAFGQDTEVVMLRPLSDGHLNFVWEVKETRKWPGISTYRLENFWGCRETHSKPHLNFWIVKILFRLYSIKRVGERDVVSPIFLWASKIFLGNSSDNSSRLSLFTCCLPSNYGRWWNVSQSMWFAHGGVNKREGNSGGCEGVGLCRISKISIYPSKIPDLFFSRRLSVFTILPEILKGVELWLSPGGTQLWWAKHGFYLRPK